MQALFEAAHATVPASHERPRLNSYDSGEEFSIDHWIEVCKVVDEFEFNDEGLPFREENEEALEVIHIKSGARRRRLELLR